jgi:hypothetical protein
MNLNEEWSLTEVAVALLAFIFVLFVYGAIPFLMVPTLGQAIWSMGFSQSMANGSLFDFYAHDFGIPKPAAMAFGLAGAWPASLLIRLGLHPSDAYSGMAALWLGVAMSSAYLIARRFGATLSIALLGAVAWMTMPIIWAHAGYSMVSLGIALLPFYFFAAFRLYLIESKTAKIAPSDIALYCLATVVSVFMDGYTFMMFATGSSILLLHSLITRPEIRTKLIKVSIPTHAISFMLAYALFSAYIGKSNFDSHSLDFFRGWGLDLSFIALPTKGMHWLPDLLGISIERSNKTFFGDASVWTTTFALPTVLIATFAWWRVGRRAMMGSGFLLLAGFAFYMSLGPSLKAHSTKPEALQTAQPGALSQMMTAETAVAPTGSAWISENLPGFNVMRASYRWSALGIFALWLLIVSWASKSQLDKKYAPWILSVLIAFNLPDPFAWWRTSHNERALFLKIDRELVVELRKLVGRGQTTAFIPWGNDYVANYLAPKTGFSTFNIGGDKNLQDAQAHWPIYLSKLSLDTPSNISENIVMLLLDGNVDTILLPHLQRFWPIESKPCLDINSSFPFNEGRRVTGFVCTDSEQWDLDAQPDINKLKNYPFVDVVELNHFSSIKLRPEFSSKAQRSALLNTILSDVKYPIILGQNFFNSAYVLQEGWYALEPHHVWSHNFAKLALPVPEICATHQCHVILKFNVFGANQQRPVSVMFDSAEPAWQWSEKIMANSDHPIDVKVPLEGANAQRTLSISIPDAASPMALSASADARVLGISLQRIDLIVDRP